jgi:galactokinase/mevalonate kinase-like predicted kinase
MKKLLSLPPNLAEYLRKDNNPTWNDYFFTSDPQDKKLGSGGGTAWLLDTCRESENSVLKFGDWLSSEKRILIHAGGQSRRLPAYAPIGKIFLPVPIFRWARGQKLDQTLLSLQLPLYEKMMEAAPLSFHTLVASGDVYIHNTSKIPRIPDADIVCCGVWVDSDIAGRHGIFFFDRTSSSELDFMLQKPDAATLQSLSQSHYFMMDIGLWMLSDKAVEILMKKSGWKGRSDEIGFYDLYSQFGPAMGKHPTIIDEEINKLTVSILPLDNAEFYHFGTGKELISSTLSIQNQTNNQKVILHKKIKPHPAIFVQNAHVELSFSSNNSEIWIENAHLGSHWILHEKHILTGIPANDWEINLPSGICIDIIPVGQQFAVRPYGFEDKFTGAADSATTLWMGKSALSWFADRGVEIAQVLLENIDDIQFSKLFPLVDTTDEIIEVLQWMIGNKRDGKGKEIWLNHERLSADEITSRADIEKILASRASLLNENRVALANNYANSIFYQIDLEAEAQAFAANKLPIPEPIPVQTDLLTQIHNRMFRSRVLQLSGKTFENDRDQAFSLLRKGILDSVLTEKVNPTMNVYPDQIVWGRSPVRIDLAGGWTDTPPYCLMEGGSVVNIAIELNGQPPIQVYAKPSKKFNITLRSIDLGATEIVEDYEALHRFHTVGSPFSIPKAALVLCGFSPDFSAQPFASLREQLQALGCGIEITLLSAVPAGSGLGTSSVLSATVLGVLSDFLGLNRTEHEICNYTLALEQLLTTGGGWQDQYGGILRGAKLLRTTDGFDQTPVTSWLPDYLFNTPSYRDCHLLYYTGITRTAKNILQEIVTGMFLNKSETLSQLADMKQHALDLADAIQRNNFEEFGRYVAKTWEQNKRLDRGTNPASIEKIITLVKDYTLGLKLPGAGGGGYLYMVAKSPEAAAKIKKILVENRPNEKARFVEMNLSPTGMQISRS